MNKTYKTIVIGSGVIGSSIAYHLSKYKDSVLVVDKGFPAQGTSGATQAWVWVHTKQPSSYGEFSMFSAELYQNLKKELDMEFELNRTGGISPIFHNSYLEQGERLIQRQKKTGIEIELLSKKEVMKKEPEINPDIVGATYSQLDGHLNPFRFVKSLVKGATNNHVDFSFYNKVYDVNKKTDALYEVITEKETFYAEEVVIAGGPWSQYLGNFFNLNVPIKLVKGQIIVTEPLRPMLNHIVTGIRQTKNGEMLIGYSKEENGFDRDISYNIIGETARYAKRVIPKLKDVNIVRTFAGVRPMPNDGLPILGEVPGKSGLFIAVTNSGVTLSPIIGLLMAELIRDGKTSYPLNDYSISRFDLENIRD